uniref:Uncharacterized protein n=1 Tax=Arundo donax TaxID=35708 RepID=A0A0A9ABI3_ARUDO
MKLQRLDASGCGRISRAG